ncbi:thiamine-phosphate pyrophosphorylase [Gordonia hirsuta DSM 44140 = NBRC 16056]|uniref:Thiamine-phosphate synthase n=1 Tax=Gordonia hirsuta DSM 44140 = NBRC 16056 TaxID=1121927 RepID=L7LBS3_9ACTN|nr:thiamine phosphate synthase [Gordonia hirsuta]GAC58201.1 thiamine-phosphate pyrophosphorylase [Gordonia hirsuta DSM 44140 = NBRC 16056]
MSSHLPSGLRARLAQSRLYLCTDARRERGDLFDFVAAALAGGVDIVQLRDKGSAGAARFGALEAAEELALLAGLKELTAAAGALLSVNDRADIAALAGADVLHLGQGDLTPAAARRIVGEEMIVGVSTHDDAQLAAADADRAVDYFCTGPCWSTPTKPGRTATGLDLVRAAAARPAGKPWFAIGGIDAARVGAVTAAGADRIVVVRAITGADDPAAAARELRNMVAVPR